MTVPGGGVTRELPNQVSQHGATASVPTEPTEQADIFRVSRTRPRGQGTPFQPQYLIQWGARIASLGATLVVKPDALLLLWTGVECAIQYHYVPLGSIHTRWETAKNSWTCDTEKSGFHRALLDALRAVSESHSARNGTPLTHEYTKKDRKPATLCPSHRSTRKGALHGFRPDRVWGVWLQLQSVL